MAGLKTRLNRLRVARPERCEIQVWLYDLGGDTATGPNGERMSHAEAEHRQKNAALVIDLRRRP